MQNVICGARAPKNISPGGLGKSNYEVELVGACWQSHFAAAAHCFSSDVIKERTSAPNRVARPSVTATVAEMHYLSLPGRAERGILDAALARRFIHGLKENARARPRLIQHLAVFCSCIYSVYVINFSVCRERVSLCCTATRITWRKIHEKNSLAKTDIICKNLC